jgi:organic radical activating enzyme
MDKYISLMKSPKDMRIICIDITNKCDLACSNCTRLLVNQDHFWDMTLENFKIAVNSVKNFPGLIILIGGNPCMHPKFSELCKIFSDIIVDKQKRGLWTNNFFKHEEISKQTFGVFNLNAHDNSRAKKSLKNFSNTKWYHGGSSTHSPILTSIRDLYSDENEMWNLISNCDVNKNWSASIVQNQGKLRGYFCEVAASFDLARKQDNGIKIEEVENWWNREIQFYEDQIKHFCPGCGLAAKLKATKDSFEIDTYTKSNKDIAVFSQKKNGRQIQEIKSINEYEKINHAVTQYSDKTKKNLKHKIKRSLWKIRKFSSYLLNKNV